MKIFDKLFGSKKAKDKSPIIPSNTSIPIKPANPPAPPEENVPRLPENFAVTDVESARQFFMACEGSFKTMTEHFPKEMCEAFKSIADYKTRYAFTKEFALTKFDSVLEGKNEHLPQVAAHVYGVARYWGMDFYDEEFIAKLTALAKLSNKKSPNTSDHFGREYPSQFQHDTWLEDYLSRYNNRDETILKVKPLVDMTYEYMNAKYPDNHDYRIGEVIRICNELRGIMLEFQSPDPSMGMEFVLSAYDDIDKILDEFSSVCNGSGGHIKGMIYQLNCIYGVRSPEFFLTAASEAVDSGSNKSWDIFRFAVVFYQENTTAVFECRRDEDGYFYPERKYREQYPVLAKYKYTLAQAIAYYRNRNALEIFKKNVVDNSIFHSNYDKQKDLCKRFGNCFAYMRERISDQSISETLTELIDCCEEVSPILGVDQTTFYGPASEQEIRECEEKNNITIPIQMREFLMFSNGASLFENSTTIYDTAEIGKFTLDGYDDENAKIYIPIGDFIGDGTMFVLNKTNGETGEYDHETGEVMIFGDFEDLLAYIMEFHCNDYMD